MLREIGDAILRLHREFDYTFFMIEHDLDFISRLCDPVIVMAEGAVLTQGSAKEGQQDEAVIEAYLGSRRKRYSMDDTMQSEPVGSTIYETSNS